MEVAALRRRERVLVMVEEGAEDVVAALWLVDGVRAASVEVRRLAEDAVEIGLEGVVGFDEFVYGADDAGRTVLIESPARNLPTDARLTEDFVC